MFSLTLLSTGDAAQALPKHTVQAAHTLGVPSAELTLLSQWDTAAKMAVTGEAFPTRPVMLAGHLERKGGKMTRSVVFLD